MIELVRKEIEVAQDDDVRVEPDHDSLFGIEHLVEVESCVIHRNLQPTAIVQKQERHVEANDFQLVFFETAKDAIQHAGYASLSIFRRDDGNREWVRGRV